MSLSGLLAVEPFGRPVEPCLRPAERIATECPVIDEICSDGEQQRRFVGVRNDQTAVPTLDPPSRSEQPGGCCEPHLSLHPFVIVGVSLQHQIAPFGAGGACVVVRRSVVQRKGEFSRLRCSQPHDEHAVGERSEIFAPVTNARCREFRYGDGPAQIEFSPVFGNRCRIDSPKSDPDGPDRLIGHAVAGLRKDRPAAKGLSLGIAPLEEQLSDSGQCAGRSRIEVVVRRTSPDGLFVELDLLLRYAAVDHGSQRTVAQRQGFYP